MNTTMQLLAALMVANLLACSSQPIQPNQAGQNQTNQTPQQASKPAIDNTEAPAVKPPPVLMNQSSAQRSQNPPMVIQQGKSKLGLVRVMDGGVCKNIQQGTKGSFLIYADLENIKSIKKTKGLQVFKEYEVKIQQFAADALQNAVDQTNLDKDPFAADNDDAQEKLAKQLAGNFQQTVAKALQDFKKYSGINLDVVPFQPSFIFFQQSCDSHLLDQDSADVPVSSH